MIGLSQLLVATDFSERAVLRDGTLATLRLTRPEDHDGVRRFFHELSPESRRLRFFSLSDPAETFIEAFCDSSNPARQATIVAFRHGDGEPRPIAVGSYLDVGSGAAEAAFAVGDADRAKGLGTILIERLATLAAINGFRRFEALVLPENQAMLEVFRDSGFEIRSTSERGAVTVHFPLAPTAQSIAAAGHRHELAYGAALPEAARRYLDHAKAPAASLASAVHLRMHGEIKLGIWLPFEAEQDISRDGRMLWRATVRGCGVPLFRGFDRLEAGQGEMQWKLFGIAPIVTATGPDISRSTAGRLLAESIWLPSLLSDVPWSSRDPRHATAAVTAAGYSSSIELTLDDAGRVEMVKTPRWGCPGGGPFRLVDFGGMVEAESTFEGYTIPTRLRAGWYVGTPRFDRDGEFFRVAVDHATFR
jgi:RimJ/RimL family protein N-acetyltransferase